VTKILIDADSVIWQSGKVKEAMEPTDHAVACALHNTKRKINKMIFKYQAEDCLVFLTKRGTTNFRLDIDPEYKANRKDVERPLHFDKIFEYIVKNYNTIEAENEEADDAVTIQFYKEHPNGFNEANKDVVLCHIDKDLNMVPGWHYNFMREEEYYVNPTQGLRFFYLQILTGDKADNVPRIKKGWRQADVEASLNQAEKEEDMLDIILKEAYNVTEDLNISEVIEQRGQLLWMRTKEGETWQLPKEIKNEQI
jgi:5'-3' exonuclease